MGTTWRMRGPRDTGPLMRKVPNTIGRIAFCAALTALGTTAASPPAHGNPFDVYGLGARSAAMGNAGAATADDFSATYYNPAGLALAQPSFNAGLMMTYDDVAIRLKDRPDGYDLPDLGAKSPLIPSKYRLSPRTDTKDIPNTYALQLGGVVAPWLEELRVGFAVGMPFNSVGEQTTRYADEREQYFSNRLDFELLGHRQQQMSVLVAAAYRVTDWLAVGFGTSLLPNSATRAGVYLADAARQDQIQMTVQNQQKWNPTVHAGVLVSPSARLALGLSWRGQNAFSLDIRNDVQIKGFQGSSASFPVPQAANFVVNFTPHQFTAGAAYKSGQMLGTVDVIRSLWSHYLDSVGDPARFSDTWSVRTGGQWQATDHSQLYAGLRYEQSPVPDQTGRTNYVDNDRAGLSGGARHRFQVGDRALDVGWFVQVQRLLARDTNKTPGAYAACTPGATAVCDEIADGQKDPVTGKAVVQAQGLQTGNPGFPGFLSWGTIFSVGVDLRVAF